MATTSRSSASLIGGTNTIPGHVHDFSHTHPAIKTFQWTYDTSITMADPGSGKCRTDTATGSPANNIAFDDLESTGLDVSSGFANLKVGDEIKFQQTNNASNWGSYRIVSTPIDKGGWWQIGVSQVEIVGTEITKNQSVTVQFTLGISMAYGITDHGLLTGLTHDDHPQYVKDTGDSMTGNYNIAGSLVTTGATFNGAVTVSGRMTVNPDSTGIEIRRDTYPELKFFKTDATVPAAAAMEWRVYVSDAATSATPQLSFVPYNKAIAATSPNGFRMHGDGHFECWYAEFDNKIGIAHGIWDGSWSGVQTLPYGASTSAGAALLLGGPSSGSDDTYLIATGGGIHLRPGVDGAYDVQITKTGTIFPTTIYTKTGSSPLIVQGAGITYPGFTYQSGGNQIAMKWNSGSGSIMGGVDNVNSMVLGTTSARKWKADIVSLKDQRAKSGKGVLDQLERLNPVEYSPKGIDGAVHSSRHHGLIADEVKGVLPGAVVETGSDPDGDTVNYLEVVATLVAAVQELSAEVKSLKAQIAA